MLSVQEGNALNKQIAFGHQTMQDEIHISVTT
jgi:hypothetical protein